MFSSNKFFENWFWKLALNSFESFFATLEQLHAHSLTMTQEVLQHRRHIKIKLDGLMQQIQDTLAAVEHARQFKIKVEQNEAEINANKILK